MAAPRRPKSRVSRWWTAVPLIIILAFNLILEKLWPSISGCLQFLILITVSAAAFGVAIGVEWLIAVMHAPWND